MKRNDLLQIRLLNDGGYPFKDNNNRTFPVIVRGYKFNAHIFRVIGCDAKAIGVSFNDDDPGFDISFIIGEEAELV